MKRSWIQDRKRLTPQSEKALLEFLRTLRGLESIATVGITPHNHPNVMLRHKVGGEVLMVFFDIKGDRYFTLAPTPEDTKRPWDEIPFVHGESEANDRLLSSYIGRFRQ